MAKFSVNIIFANSFASAVAFTGVSAGTSVTSAIGAVALDHPIACSAATTAAGASVASAGAVAAVAIDSRLAPVRRAVQAAHAAAYAAAAAADSADGAAAPAVAAAAVVCRKPVAIAQQESRIEQGARRRHSHSVSSPKDVANFSAGWVAARRGQPRGQP